MRTKIEALATYYLQFHHTLIGWQITLSGFVFAALLAADVANIKGNCLAVCCVYTAVILFPITFLAAIAQYGKRIELLDQYLDLPDKDIPATG